MHQPSSAPNTWQSRYSFIPTLGRLFVRIHDASRRRSTTEKAPHYKNPPPRRSNAAVTFGKHRGCALPANSFDPAICAETPESIRVILNPGENTEAANASSSVHALFSPHNESQGGSSTPDCDMVCMSSPRWKKLVLIWEARRRWREVRFFSLAHSGRGDRTATPTPLRVG
ncbi:conserved hypothetical protein [Coccidioides posadasii str. Silveira]|uniref:Uncharacterized protein n=1 Tax=Coccidioides posadasii (strain RMSCC 757 / Silveira) TaxID=443226 RepID=E9DC93_COCPS|nr:conserved hypothetical protein [Coccidioides posadasii str. Silveira]